MVLYKMSQKVIMDLGMIHIFMCLNLKRLWLNLALKKRKRLAIEGVHYVN